MMQWDLQELVNLGVPMVILAAIGYALWRFGWYTVHRVFGDDSKGSKGIAGEWVDGEMKWRNSLTERLEKQTNACEGHIETVKALGDSLSQQMEAAQLAKEAAALAAEAAAEGNKSLHHIDEMLLGRTDMIRNTAEGITQLKACVFHMCDLCQCLVAKEFPGSAGDVSGYLMAIKRKVNDEQS